MKTIILIACLLVAGNVWGDEIDEIIPFIIQAESGGDPSAIGDGGNSVGLMQINVNGALKEWNDDIDNILQNSTRTSPGNLTKKPYKPNYVNEKEVSKEDARKTYWYKYHAKTYSRKQYGLLDLYTAKINIKVGTWYLRRLRDHYLKDELYTKFQKDFKKMYPSDDVYETAGIGVDAKKCEDYCIETLEDYDLTLILAAYNGGITRLREVNYDINKMPKSTQRYVKKIMRLHQASKAKES